MIYCMQQQLVSHKKSLCLFIFKLALLKKFYFIISCSVNTFLFMMFASLQMLLVIRYPRKEPPHLAISSYFETYFFHLQPTWAYSFIIFFVYRIHRAICRLSDHSVDRPPGRYSNSGRAELVAGTLTTIQTITPVVCDLVYGCESFVVVESFFFWGYSQTHRIC